MAANPVLDTLLFVDTNVFLDFYRIRKSDVSTSYLEQLEICRDRLSLTALNGLGCLLFKLRFAKVPKAAQHRSADQTNCTPRTPLTIPHS